MIYMQGDVTIVVLETANVEELKKGRPAKSPDGKVLIAWCPDVPWLAARLMELFKRSEDYRGESPDAVEVAKLIDEARRRPENPTPPKKKGK